MYNALAGNLNPSLTACNTKPPMTDQCLFASRILPPGVSLRTGLLMATWLLTTDHRSGRSVPRPLCRLICRWSLGYWPPITVLWRSSPWPLCHLVHVSPCERSTWSSTADVIYDRWPIGSVWLQNQLILFGFWLSQVEWIGFSSLVARWVNKWSHGLWVILVGNCHKCIQNEVSKVFCKRNWSWLGFGWTKLGGLAFYALLAKLVNKWSYGFWQILVGNCHKCINEVWKVWLQKELILVGFWFRHGGWICFLWLGSKIGEKVKSWFLSNLGGEVSQMYAKWGV